MIDYKLFIATELGKRTGKFTIRGLGITVMDVLECLAEGMTRMWFSPPAGHPG